MAKAIRKVRVTWGKFSFPAKIMPLTEPWVIPHPVQIHRECSNVITQMAFCPECHSELGVTEIALCPKCEKPVLIKEKLFCPECNTELEESVKREITEDFCPQCKKQVKRSVVPYCPSCQKELGPKDVREPAYKYGDSFVVVKSSEIAGIEEGLPSPEVLKILEFVPQGSASPLYQEPYALEPDGDGEYPYALLLQGLLETGTMAICDGNIRKPYRMGLMVYKGSILVLPFFYHDEVHPPELSLPEVTEYTLDLMKRGIRSSMVDLDPEKHCRNLRRERFEDLLERASKRPGRVITPPPGIPEGVLAITRSLQENLARIQEKVAEKAKKAKPKGGKSKPKGRKKGK